MEAMLYLFISSKQKAGVLATKVCWVPWRFSGWTMKTVVIMI